MNVERSLLEEAGRRGIISPAQAAALWDFLQEHTRDTPAFTASHVLHYLGGLLAIGAMTVFMTLGWERFGGYGLFLVAAAYAAAGYWATDFLLARKRLPIAAGITGALVVSLAPLAIYGIQVELGAWVGTHAYRAFHGQLDWRWLWMELGAIGVGVAMLRRFPLPFLVMPIAFTLWYMTMDLATLLAGNDDPTGSSQRAASLVLGIAVIVLAVVVDLRSRRGKDFAFWLHLAGVLASWSALTLMPFQSEADRFLYLLANLLMILVGALLDRRVFAVFGGIGTAGYLGHLAHEVFADSVMFPVMLTLIGLGIVGLGIRWQRYERSFVPRIRALLPEPLRSRLEDGGRAPAPGASPGRTSLGPEPAFVQCDIRTSEPGRDPDPSDRQTAEPPPDDAGASRCRSSAS